jgi:hypothetical protein
MPGFNFPLPDPNQQANEESWTDSVTHGGPESAKWTDGSGLQRSGFGS